MHEPKVFWIVLLIPGLAKKLIEHNHLKISHTTWHWLTAFETIGFILFFVCVGFWLAYQFAKDQTKTFEILQKNYRDDLKDEFKKLHDVQVPLAQERAQLKTQVEGLQSEMEQMERLISFLEDALNDEKKRNNRTPEEANKEALEALS